ncbi:MAG: MFS transporter [Clostridia bacterium]|nr:MFS transporter [Clostridia bacterium]
MKFFSNALWKNKNFNFLWAGATVSLVGTEVTNLALPVVALMILKAGAMEVAIIKAAEMIAFPFLGLFAGVMADRLNPRRIMIVADSSRFLLLSLIPLAYVLGFLNIYVLIAVTAIMSIFAVFYNIAYSAYVPLIVERDQLVEGNSKLNTSQSVAQFMGPMIAGWLTLIVGAVKSLLVDVCSYLFSVVMLLMSKQVIRHEDSITKNKLPRKSIWADIKEGLHFVFSDKTMRKLIAATGFANLGHSIAQPMFLVFAYKRLGISAERMGIILAFGSIGLFIGSVVATKIAQRFGLGKSMFFSMGLVGIAALVTPAALLGVPEITLALVWFTICFADTIYNINQFTLRQLLTPFELQGRMNATVRIIIFGVMPVGSVLGGLLAAKIGLVVSLIVGGLAYLMVPVIVYVSHLYSIQQHPDSNRPVVEPAVVAE